MNSRHAFMAIAHLALLASHASAQSSDTGQPRLWLTMGVGTTTAYIGGVAGGVSLAIVDGRAIYGLRYIGEGLVAFCFGHCGGDGLERSENDLGLTYGYRYELGPIQLSAAGGLSLVRGIHPHRTRMYPRDPIVPFTTLGMAAEGRLTLAGSEGEGMGLSLLWYGNLNPIAPFHGVLLSLHLGTGAIRW